MKKDTIYAIIAVAILLVTVYSALIVVGLVDNPLAPNHFVGSWVATNTETGEQETWIFKRPMLGQWGTGLANGWTFEYKYTDTKLITRINSEIYMFDYSFSSDHSLFVLSLDGATHVTFVKV